MKDLVVEWRDACIAPHARAMGAAVYRDYLLGQYQTIDDLEEAQSLARAFRDPMGDRSFNTVNNKAAYEAGRAVGLTPCQFNHRHFLVRVVDVPEVQK